MCLSYIIVAGTTEVAGYQAQGANLRNQQISRASTDAGILAAGSVLNLSFPNANQTTLHNVVHALAGAQGVSGAEVIGSGGVAVASTLPSQVGKHLHLEFYAIQPEARAMSNGDVVGIAPVVSGNQDLGMARVVLS